MPGDASDPEQVQSVVNQAVEHFGKIDILVNMAGRQYRWAVWDVNIHDWERQLKGYLTGGMLTTKYVSRVMMDKGIRGSIIHIVSDAGHQGEAGNSGYSAAKGGLLNFCRAAAMDLAHLGIRVNTISPHLRRAQHVAVRRRCIAAHEAPCDGGRLPQGHPAGAVLPRK